jgi:hypothetical protein
MRRDLTIRCVSTGTVRTDGPDSAHCVLREVSLELDGTPAHVRIVDSWDHGQRRRDTAVQLDRILVRSRAGYDIALPTPDARKPLDWLIAIAESMTEGERLTVSLWVRSMDLAALLNVAPVSARDFSRTRARVTDEEERTAAALPSPSPRLRLIPAAS